MHAWRKVASNQAPGKGALGRSRRLARQAFHDLGGTLLTWVWESGGAHAQGVP